MNRCLSFLLPLFTALGVLSSKAFCIEDLSLRAPKTTQSEHQTVDYDHSWSVDLPMGSVSSCLDNIEKVKTAYRERGDEEKKIPSYSKEDDGKGKEKDKGKGKEREQKQNNSADQDDNAHDVMPDPESSSGQASDPASRGKGGSGSPDDSNPAPKGKVKASKEISPKEKTRQKERVKTINALDLTASTALLNDLYGFEGRHQIPFVADVMGGAAEETRGRSVEKSAQSQRDHTPETDRTTHYEITKTYASSQLDKMQDARDKSDAAVRKNFESFKITKDQSASNKSWLPSISFGTPQDTPAPLTFKEGVRAGASYTLNALGLVGRGLDLATGGAISNAREAYYAAGEDASTLSRRATREATGDARFGQQVGEGVKTLFFIGEVLIDRKVGQAVGKVIKTGKDIIKGEPVSSARESILDQVKAANQNRFAHGEMPTPANRNLFSQNASPAQIAHDNMQRLMTGTDDGARFTQSFKQGVASSNSLFDQIVSKRGGGSTSSSGQIGRGSATGQGTAPNISSSSSSSQKPLDRKTNVNKAESPIWKGFQPYRGEYRTNGQKGSAREYYKWDKLHNDIEVFDHQYYHKGSMNPQTGKIYKTSVIGRREKGLL